MIALTMLAAAMSIAELDRAVQAAPHRVRTLIERRQGCNHWAGEEPYDKERVHEMAAAMRTLQCGRVPADEQAIRKAYAKQPDLLRLIDETMRWEY